MKTELLGRPRLPGSSGSKPQTARSTRSVRPQLTWFELMF